MSTNATSANTSHQSGGGPNGRSRSERRLEGHVRDRAVDLGDDDCRDDRRGDPAPAPGRHLAVGEVQQQQTERREDPPRVLDGDRDQP